MYFYWGFLALHTNCTSVTEKKKHKITNTHENLIRFEFRKDEMQMKKKEVFICLIWFLQRIYSRLQSPRSFWPVAGSKTLAWSNTGSPRFTDFPSNLANLIGWEYETNTLRILRKSDRARALDPCHRPEGSWALGTRMIFFIHKRMASSNPSYNVRRIIASLSGRV